MSASLFGISVAISLGALTIGISIGIPLAKIARALECITEQEPRP